MGESIVALEQLRIDVGRELTRNILPFYFKHAVDKHYCGFYGRIDNDNRIHHTAPKGLVQISRIMWTYSRAYQNLRSDAYLAVADHDAKFLLDHFWDEDAGGMYWMVDFQG